VDDFSMTSYVDGPQPFSQAERRKHLQKITDQLRRHFGEDLLALGVYGSTGRGTDGPFSDIEIHTVLRGKDIDYSYEWSTGPWKAEVDIYSQDVFLHKAGEMDEFWPITHAAYAQIAALHDPEIIFPRAAEAVYDHSEVEVERVIREVIVGDFYEIVGKARNALALGRDTSLAAEAVDSARYAACLMGLAHKRLFTSAQTIFSEVLQLPGRPAGFDDFLGLVMRGELNDNRRIASSLDILWSGLEAWSSTRGLRLHYQFGELIHRK
jgi:kanamycin nucleotidyltransferase